MRLGVDTSFANGTCDWDQAAKDDRLRWVYARACYGTNAYDDDGAPFIAAHDACKRLGIPFCSYVFWLAWQDGAAQAQHFLQTASGRYGRSVIVDVEEGSGLHGWGGALSARIDNLARTLSAIETTCGQPIIYTNADTWTSYFGGTDAFAGHRFIIAQYSGVPGRYDPVPGIRHVIGHQFSDGRGLAPIPGLSKPDNNVDRDVLLGDFSILEAP